MRLTLLLFLTATQLFAQSEKISLTLLPAESSDKVFKKEVGDAFSNFKEDGIKGKLVVDSAWQIAVTIVENRDERKNDLNLWVVKETFKKQTNPEQFFLIHKTNHTYETAFDLERGTVGSHDPIFSKALVFLSSQESQGELTGRRISRFIAKESNDNKNEYTQTVITMYSLNEASGQLKVQGTPMTRGAFRDLIGNFEQ